MLLLSPLLEIVVKSIFPYNTINVDAVIILIDLIELLLK